MTKDTDFRLSFYLGVQHLGEAWYLIHRFEADSLREALLRREGGDVEFLVGAPDALDALKRSLVWLAASRIADE